MLCIFIKATLLTKSSILQIIYGVPTMCQALFQALEHSNDGQARSSAMSW